MSAKKILMMVGDYVEDSVLVSVDGIEEYVVVGDSIKIDLDGDGEYYDILITLGSTSPGTNRADITIKLIEDLIAEEEAPIVSEQIADEEIFGLTLEEIVAILISLVLVAVVYF